MKILFGYDGSECSDDAIADMARAGLPEKADLTVIAVADVFLPPETADEETSDDEFPLYVPQSVLLARERAEHAFDEAKSMGERAAAQISRIFPGWAVHSEARADTPHWAIIAKAEEWRPDLIVVGSQGRTALGRFVLGSVSQKILHETTCSVRISRRVRTASSAEPSRLVLATDGSADADSMIESVISRRWNKGTKVKLVTAYETFFDAAISPDAVIRRIRDIQDVAAEKLSHAGLEIERVVTGEDPKHYLIRMAEDWEADCIFLGAKGHRFFERLFLGSVSSAVAARAHCSVEVVRNNRP